MRRYFFIDKENTGKRFLKGMKNLTVKDTVIIFHYEKSGQISSEILSEMASSKAATEVRKMTTHTKNAMDFQITTYLGYMISLKGNLAEYYIVSDDKGYDASIEFVKNNISENITLRRINSEMSNLNTNMVVAQNPNLEIDKVLCGKYKKKVINRIKQAIKTSTSKEDFHNHLQKHFSKDFNSIYNLVKPIFEESKSVLGSI